jgi:hypothetical protein
LGFPTQGNAIELPCFSCYAESGSKHL